MEVTRKLGPQSTPTGIGTVIGISNSSCTGQQQELQISVAMYPITSKERIEKY
jgi:hypothetical protein